MEQSAGEIGSCRDPKKLCSARAVYLVVSTMGVFRLKGRVAEEISSRGFRGGDEGLKDGEGKE